METFITKFIANPMVLGVIAFIVIISQAYLFFLYYFLAKKSKIFFDNDLVSINRDIKMIKSEYLKLDEDINIQKESISLNPDSKSIKKKYRKHNIDASMVIQEICKREGITIGEYHFMRQHNPKEYKRLYNNNYERIRRKIKK